LKKIELACEKQNDTPVVCKKYAELTTEELRAAKKEEEELFKSALATTAFANKIKEENGVGSGGECACYKCAGVFRWRISSNNGYIWGKCETDGGLNLRE